MLKRGARLLPYLESLAEIDAEYRHVRVTLPGAHYRLERVDLRIWAGGIAVEPHAHAAVALIPHFASVRGLTPAAAVLRRQGQTHTAVVRHVAASVYHQVYVVRIIQRLGAAPDHGERHRNVWRTRRVGEFGVVAIDRVGQKTRVHARHAALDVELTHEASLYDELLKKIAFL